MRRVLLPAVTARKTRAAQAARDSVLEQVRTMEPLLDPAAADVPATRALRGLAVERNSDRVPEPEGRADLILATHPRTVLGRNLPLEDRPAENRAERAEQASEAAQAENCRPAAGTERMVQKRILTTRRTFAVPAQGLVRVAGLALVEEARVPVQVWAGRDRQRSADPMPIPDRAEGRVADQVTPTSRSSCLPITCPACCPRKSGRDVVARVLAGAAVTEATATEAEAAPTAFMLARAWDRAVPAEVKARAPVVRTAVRHPAVRRPEVRMRVAALPEALRLSLVRRHQGASGSGRRLGAAAVHRGKCGWGFGRATFRLGGSQSRQGLTDKEDDPDAGPRIAEDKASSNGEKGRSHASPAVRPSPRKPPSASNTNWKSG